MPRRLLVLPIVALLALTLAGAASAACSNSKFLREDGKAKVNFQQAIRAVNSGSYEAARMMVLLARVQVTSKPAPCSGKLVRYRGLFMRALDSYEKGINALLDGVDIDGALVQFRKTERYFEQMARLNP
jgi:hypothetical protein